ncbi:hypothetical protein BC833DRAFT_566240 [Globomyces pollinis-pini]|nr:hypothetical protein BC833DRAFT_566240 [Globomyces pollinis-pini]
MEDDNNLQLKFLYEAAHQVFNTCPQVSKYLITRFIEHSNDERITISPSTSKNYCHRCGSLFVPGLNVGVKTVKSLQQFNSKSHIYPSRKRDKREKQKNYIVYDCASCTISTVMPGVFASELDKLSSNPIINLDENVANSTVSSPIPNNVTSKVGKKKKSKKNHTLLSLIGKKETSKSSTYSLTDFLSDV